jgi:hypothetical protein
MSTPDDIQPVEQRQAKRWRMQAVYNLATLILALVALILAVSNKTDNNASNATIEAAKVLENGDVIVVTASSTPPSGYSLVGPLVAGLGSWSTLTELPYAVSDLASIEYEGKIYIFAGLGGTVFSRIFSIDFLVF